MHVGLELNTNLVGQWDVKRTHDLQPIAKRVRTGSRIEIVKLWDVATSHAFLEGEEGL